MREIVALLFWQSEITVKCHKVDTLSLSAFQNFGHNAYFVYVMVGSTKVSVINNLFTQNERKIDHLSVLTFEAFPHCACDRYVYLSAMELQL